MERVARLAAIFALIGLLYAPPADPTRAAAAMMPSIELIRIPGVSPLATVVNATGTRALLVVWSKTLDFLLYDLHSRALLHRVSVKPTSATWTYSAVAAFDERRQRAYVVMNAPKHIALNIYAVDFSTGEIAATYGIGLLSLGVQPKVDETTGNVWLVALSKAKAYLARIRPSMRGGAVTQLDLAAVGATSNSDIPSNSLSIDAPARRLILTWNYNPRAYAGFDLGSGRAVWTARPHMLADAILQPVLDVSTGDVWVADSVDPIVNVIHVKTGAVRRLVVGDQHQSVERLSPAPASGVLVVRSGHNATELVSVAPGGRQHVLARIPLKHMAQVFGQLIGPTKFAYVAAVYAERLAANTVRDYYLSYDGEGTLAAPHLAPASKLSVFDWGRGAVLSQQALPIQGELVVGNAGTFHNGFYATIGLGTRNLDTLRWDGAALLVVRTQ